MSKIILVLCIICVWTWGGTCVNAAPYDFDLPRMVSARMVSARGNDVESIPDIIIMELNGKLYYVDNLAELLSDKNKNTCIYGNTDGDINTLYNMLLDTCKQNLASLGQDGDMVGWINKVVIPAAKHTVGLESALRYCLITKEKLQQRHSDDLNKIESGVVINADLDACISKIGVHTDKNSCPTNFSVPDEKYLDNLYNLNDTYGVQVYTFNYPYSSNGMVAVFNGYVFIVCDGGNPVYMTIPSYSGREQCQGGEFAAIPYMGSIPSGVYLARYEELERKGGAWGGYRIRLRPAHEVNTMKRDNFYLHGSDKVDKHSSGGCLSLGTDITTFVNDFFVPYGGDLVVVVDMVPNVEQEWNK